MWPKQSACAAFYGDPRSTEFKKNLVTIAVPWACTTAWDGKPYNKLQIHKKCADSLQRVLLAIWDAAGRDQAKIDEWGMNKCGGTYAFRSMRGGKSLSIHSYGAAIDWDPTRNALGDSTPHLAKCAPVIKAFKDEGWVWGGDWRKADGMHFQAAIV